MSSIDYSTWDALEVSESEDEEDNKADNKQPVSLPIPFQCAFFSCCWWHNRRAFFIIFTLSPYWWLSNKKLSLPPKVHEAAETAKVQHDPVCENCGTYVTKMLRCAKCKDATYCGVEKNSLESWWVCNVFLRREFIIAEPHHEGNAYMPH